MCFSTFLLNDGAAKYGFDMFEWMLFRELWTVMEELSNHQQGVVTGWKQIESPHQFTTAWRNHLSCHILFRVGDFYNISIVYNSWK